MGWLKHSCTYAIAVLFLCSLSGCVLSTIAAIPGAMYGVVADQFSGEEESFASAVEPTLFATQQSLNEMSIDIDMLEIQNSGGYGIAFNNNNLDGEITLTRQTERLTTVYVSVKAMVREDSVERAIIQMIRAELKKKTAERHFKVGRFHNLRAKPSIQSKRLGWFRPGARLDAHRIGTKGWLKVKMPSGKMAYLKGSIHKQK